MSPQTGAAAQSGQFMRNGINLALDAVNAKGGVLGRKMEIVVADDQTTNPGAVLAFSRLASDPAMVAFIGSIRSTQVQAMAPDVLKQGKPMMIGGTDPRLTHQGNRWLVPLPAERHLFGQDDRGLWHRDARPQEDRPHLLDRRVRHWRPRRADGRI